LQKVLASTDNDAARTPEKAKPKFRRLNDDKKSAKIFAI